MRRTGPLDAAFFGFEGPGHPFHSQAVMVLDPATVPGGYSFRRLRIFIAARLAGIPPLRQRLVPAPLGLTRPCWVDSQVDISAHVFRHVRKGGTMADVAAFAAGLATTPLDRSKPLWAMHVIEGLQDGKIAVVAQVHHALMDGVAGMDFLASMFSLRPEANEVLAVDGGSSAEPSPLDMLATVVVPELLTTPLRTVRAIGETLQAIWRVRRSIRAQGPLGLSLAPRMRWNGGLGGRRIMAFASLPLTGVKAVSHTAGCTVNDVIMSVVGGACRSYLLERDDLPKASLVAAVPISTRDGMIGPQTANAVALTLSSLATDVTDPKERLDVVHGAMARAKRLQEALGDNTLTDVLAAVSPLVLDVTARAYLGLHLFRWVPGTPNLLVSNVAGPPVPLYFGGARLVALYPLGPIYEGVGLNVTVVSCAEDIGFGFVSSPDVIDDLGALANRVGDELQALREACAAQQAA